MSRLRNGLKKVKNWIVRRKTPSSSDHQHPRPNKPFGFRIISPLAWAIVITPITIGALMIAYGLLDYNFKWLLEIILNKLLRLNVELNDKKDVWRNGFAALALGIIQAAFVVRSIPYPHAGRVRWLWGMKVYAIEIGLYAGILFGFLKVDLVERNYYPINAVVKVYIRDPNNPDAGMPIFLKADWQLCRGSTHEAVRHQLRYNDYGTSRPEDAINDLLNAAATALQEQIGHYKSPSDLIQNFKDFEEVLRDEMKRESEQRGYEIPQTELLLDAEFYDALYRLLPQNEMAVRLSKTLGGEYPNFATAAVLVALALAEAYRHGVEIKYQSPSKGGKEPQPALPDESTLKQMANALSQFLNRGGGS